jgi:hypothetical protein
VELFPEITSKAMVVSYTNSKHTWSHFALSDHFSALFMFSHWDHICYNSVAALFQLIIIVRLISQHPLN